MTSNFRLNCSHILFEIVSGVLGIKRDDKIFLSSLNNKQSNNAYYITT